MFIKILAIVLATFGIVYVGWNMMATVADDLIVGKAFVIDADTFVVDGIYLRVFAVDGPAKDQVCAFTGKAGVVPWLCGQKALMELREWIGDSTLICRRRGKPYERIVATCMNGFVDVGGWLVSHGWAVAETCYSRIYVDDQERAKQAKAGLWGSTFERTRCINESQAPIAYEGLRTRPANKPTITTCWRRASMTIGGYRS